MTYLTCADSIYPQNLTPGYDSYLGYADGDFPTGAVLPALFPGKPLIILTVTGGTLDADGCDVETGNLTPQTGATWTANKLAADPDSLPVVYASVLNMTAVLGELKAVNVQREQVRLLSAHYLAGPHVCGPASCNQVSIPMNGTQWSCSAEGLGGTLIDSSLLEDGFFGTPPSPQWTEFDMAKLPVLQSGSADKAGEFWSVHRLQALLVMTGKFNSIPAAASLAEDGSYGTLTERAVKAVQGHYKLTVDGIAGPEVWSALLTGSAS